MKRLSEALALYADAGGFFEDDALVMATAKSLACVRVRIER
ncbi:MAG: hypothetical protein VX464_20810 [Pseudomonadota bacterium]|nr:hypothetical protein [Pseudomonadota bacterium]